MNTIKMIPVSEIQNNPDNPRKDIGDVSELAESIKANGIMQNLTVIPRKEGGYYALIGHRRLAAAKLAGLTEVPCTVSDLDRKEQIAVMLSENMQRKDLTVIEEADSMQLMLDMGATVSEVSEKTGLSETTVRRRVRLLEFDRDILEQAAERCPRLEDYDELRKIKDPDTRNKVLKDIGTNNFKFSLTSAIRNEENEEKKKKLIAWAEERGIEIITSIDYQRYKHEKDVNIDNENTWELPQLPKGAKRYGCIWGSAIYIYRDKTAEDLAAEEKSQKERSGQYEKARINREKIKEIHKVMYETRLNFMKSFTGFGENSIVKERNGFRGLAAVFFENLADVDYKITWDIMCELTGADNNIDDEYELVCDILDLNIRMDKLMVYAMYASIELPDECYCSWDCKWQDNPRLNAVYRLLKELGYKKSDEEAAIINGTHELFIK